MTDRQSGERERDQEIDKHTDTHTQEAKASPKQALRILNEEALPTSTASVPAFEVVAPSRSTSSAAADEAVMSDCSRKPLSSCINMP